MLQGETEDPLARAAVQVEDGDGVAGNLTGHFFERGRVERFLIAKVVIEQSLVDTGGGGNGPGARAGEAVLAEFADGGVEDAVPGLVGAVVVGFEALIDRLVKLTG